MTTTRPIFKRYLAKIFSKPVLLSALLSLISYSSSWADQNAFIYVAPESGGLVVEDFQGTNILTWKLIDPINADERIKADNPLVKFIGEKPKTRGQGLYNIAIDSSKHLYLGYKYTSITKLNPTGSYQWVSWGHYHHDIALSVDEELLYTFERVILPLPYFNNKTAKVDLITALRSDSGKVEKKINLFEILKPYLRPIWSRFKNGKSNPDVSKIYKDGTDDLMHCNSIETIVRPIDDIAVPGDLLISCAAPGIVAIIDPVSSKLKWIFSSPGIRWQHDASITSAGNVMFLDNHFKSKPKTIAEDTSRVVIVDLKSKSIIWNFFKPGWQTKTKGSAQELDNGNIHITYAQIGLLVEITKDKKIVREHKLKLANLKNLFRTTRVPADIFIPPAN